MQRILIILFFVQKSFGMSSLSSAYTTDDYFNTVHVAIKAYYCHCGYIPRAYDDLIINEAGVSACTDWRGPYLPSDARDAWGNQIFYFTEEKYTYRLISLGKYKKQGSIDDMERTVTLPTVFIDAAYNSKECNSEKYRN